MIWCSYLPFVLTLGKVTESLIVRTTFKNVEAAETAFTLRTTALSSLIVLVITAWENLPVDSFDALNFDSFRKC